MTLRVENNGADYFKVAYCGHRKPIEVDENGRPLYHNMTRTGIYGYNWDLCGDAGKELGKGLNGLKIWNYDDFTFEQIGEGFYGTVFKAVHKYTKDVLVLKELKNAADDEHKKMFEEEIKLLVKLCHPNLLKFKGLAVHESRLCFLAEYIEGGCLEDLIASRDHQLSGWTTRINIALDVARAMAYLHSEGVMHRDLAAKNILVRKKANGKLQAIVADLGLSYTIPNLMLGEEYVLDTVGSPYHMAPEVINSKPYSLKADIFSYGIILCEIISGCPGADPDEIPRTQEFGLAIEEFTELVSDCPTEFLDLTVRCCQVVPNLRPSFVDIVKVLDITLDKLQEKCDDRKLSLPQANSRNRVLSMDYMIEPSIVCTCGNREDLPDDDFLGIKLAEDRLGTLQRTASRQVLRKLVTRCSVCGGRLLVPNLDSPIISNRTHKQNGTSERETVHPSGNRASVENVSDRMPGETERTVREYAFTAGTLLHQDSEAIVAGTTHLVENTPGRLPKFFHYILRTKKTRLRPRDGGSGKRKIRKSLQDLFSSNATSGNYLHGDRREHDGNKSGHSSCLTSPREEKLDENGLDSTFVDGDPRILRENNGVDVTQNHSKPQANPVTRKGHSTSINTVDELVALNLDSPVSRRHSMPSHKFAAQNSRSSETHSSSSEKSLKMTDDSAGDVPFKKKRSRSIFSLFRRKKSD